MNKHLVVMSLLLAVNMIIVGDQYDYGSINNDDASRRTSTHFESISRLTRLRYEQGSNHREETCMDSVRSFVNNKNVKLGASIITLLGLLGIVLSADWSSHTYMIHNQGNETLHLQYQPGCDKTVFHRYHWHTFPNNCVRNVLPGEFVTLSNTDGPLTKLCATHDLHYKWLSKSDNQCATDKALIEKSDAEFNVGNNLHFTRVDQNISTAHENGSIALPSWNTTDFGYVSDVAPSTSHRNLRGLQEK